MTDSITGLAPTTAATASARTSGAPDTPALTSDFDAFLRMLTAQARYQDPMEPIDSTEYAAQLAQFSMVEQQIRTNDTLADLSARIGLANMAALSGWVGMEVRANAPVQFDGAPITVSPNPAALADSAVLVVQDATGREVQRAPIPVSTDPVQWAGTAPDGTPFPAGLYSFSVESRANGELLHSGPVEVYARVTEAQVRGGETVLILPGGQAIYAQSVTALRQPAAAGT